MSKKSNSVKRVLHNDASSTKNDNGMPDGARTKSHTNKPGSNIGTSPAVNDKSGSNIGTSPWMAALRPAVLYPVSLTYSVVGWLASA